MCTTVGCSLYHPVGVIMPARHPFPPSQRWCGPAAGNGSSAPDLPPPTSLRHDNTLAASQRASREDAATPCGGEELWDICRMAAQMWRLGLTPEEIGVFVACRIAELPRYQADEAGHD